MEQPARGYAQDLAIRAQRGESKTAWNAPPLWDAVAAICPRSLIAVAVVSNQEGSLMVSFRSMNAPLVHWSR